MIKVLSLIFVCIGLSVGNVVHMEHRNTKSSPLETVKSDWGYVTVREHAHMFWWLFHQDPSYQPSFLGKVDPIPLIVWFQGGPGASGVGYGNFEEIGPFDLNMNRRNTSWTGLAHVLFVDNPVGSGYSYVTDPSAYTTDVQQIATDMVALLRGFFDKHPEMSSNPFYIFGQSYGGKMAAATALEISKEVEAGTINVNLQGIALGDAWISPMDSVNTWADYLYQTGLLDDPGLVAVKQSAQATQTAVDNGEWEQATNLWSLTELVIMKHSDFVDFYNILDPHYPDGRFLQRIEQLSYRVPKDLATGYALSVDAFAADPLTELMEGDVKIFLGIPDTVTWGGQSDPVFTAQGGDFMKPVIDLVDECLNTGMKVIVYNGHLDLIVDTPGQELWVKRMAWPQLSNFMSMNWTPRYAYAGEDTGGYSKKLDNFQFWWMLKAGHSVPADVGEFALYMLHDIITS